MSDEDRAVIFDLDGVLVDSYWPHLESWQLLAKEDGVSFTEKHFAATFGRRSREIIATIWRSKKKLSDDEIDEIDQRKEELYREALSKNFPAMAGAVELIQNIHQAGFKIALGSSAPQENIDICLDKLKVRDHVGAVVNGTEVSKGKPDPEVFFLAAERIGIHPAACAVIEDAPTGIEAAVAAGMSSLAFASSGRKAFEYAGADLVFTSLRQLSSDFINEIIERRLAEPEE